MQQVDRLRAMWQDTSWTIRAFHREQIKARNGDIITVDMHTMAGTFQVQWEVIDEDGVQVIARRRKK
jgi:methionine-rich copper-binding protein CopC